MKFIEAESGVQLKQELFSSRRCNSWGLFSSRHFITYCTQTLSVFTGRQWLIVYSGPQILELSAPHLVPCVPVCPSGPPGEKGDRGESGIGQKGPRGPAGTSNSSALITHHDWFQAGKRGKKKKREKWFRRMRPYLTAPSVLCWWINKTKLFLFS